MTSVSLSVPDSWIDRLLSDPALEREPATTQLHAQPREEGPRHRASASRRSTDVMWRGRRR